MTLRDVRVTLRDTIQAKLPKFRVYPNMTATVEVPAVIVQPSTDVEIPSADYFSGFGVTKWYLDLTILVPYKNMDLSMELLDRVVSRDDPMGLPYIMSLTNTPSLKERFRTLKCLKMRDYGGRYTVGDVTYIGACIKLEAEEHCPSVTE